jgi:pilus assembly protein CpaE
LQAALSELSGVAVLRRLEHYPQEVDLVRLVRACAPHVIFLSAESLTETLAVARSIEAQALGLQTVAVHHRCDPGILLEIMRAGVREFLSPPFSTKALRDALLRIKEIVDRTPPPVDTTDRVFTFLPSKAGVGTSTIALNASVAFADVPDTGVLLADFDLNCGIIDFMLKLENPYSMVNAAENCQQLDDNLWRQLVTSVGGLDVLPSGNINSGFRIEPAQIRHLMDFARRHYKVICVDLSGSFEKYSIEVMHESQQIFLVCTQELPSLHLARAKLNSLRALDLDERISIIVNRVHKRASMGTTEIEKLLGLPVKLMFPNDYPGVHRALANGKRVAPSSELGKRFRAMADTILARKPLKVARKRRFVEYFSILPARYSLFPARKKSTT